jgi:hypothetical protein
MRLKGAETEIKRTEIRVSLGEVYDALKKEILEKYNIDSDAYFKDGKAWVDNDYRSDSIIEVSDLQLQILQTLSDMHTYVYSTQCYTCKEILESLSGVVSYRDGYLCNPCAERLDKFCNCDLRDRQWTGWKCLTCEKRHKV